MAVSCVTDTFSDLSACSVFGAGYVPGPRIIRKRADDGRVIPKRVGVRAFRG
ncbi:MAG: hypothetical protein OXF02_06565 [Simkaniaceae bacterium]|nr:hypothetical protein [Simkaniaceae bacterium]